MVDFKPSNRKPAADVRRGWDFLCSALSLPLLALLWLYRRLVSPVLPPACRYYPSCSQYAEEAVRLRGPFVGPALALWRLLRCHPWAAGGPDPVPHSLSKRPIPAESVPPSREASASVQRIA
jgi:putative membrane protein insertion efficiency factor